MAVVCGVLVLCSACSYQDEQLAASLPGVVDWTIGMLRSEWVRSGTGVGLAATATARTETGPMHGALLNLRVSDHDYYGEFSVAPMHTHGADPRRVTRYWLGAGGVFYGVFIGWHVGDQEDWGVGVVWELGGVWRTTPAFILGVHVYLWAGEDAGDNFAFGAETGGRIGIATRF